LIFENVFSRNAAADNDPECIRISIDTKAAVCVGEYSRGGQSRCQTPVKAMDHDMAKKEKLVPVGVLEPQTGATFIAFGNDNKTSDLIVDTIEAWYEVNSLRLKENGIKKLVVNADNGPECNSHRSQFMMRMANFSDASGMEIHMVYYPPYHSKYNSIEHYWGGLERAWNGYLLGDIETVLRRTANFCWRKTKTLVSTLFGEYPKGIRLNKEEQKVLEQRLIRSISLPKWNVVIKPKTVF
jgi:hypothetical protein